MALTVSLDTSGIEALYERAALLTEKNLRYVIAGSMTAAAKAAQQSLKEATTSGRYISKPTPWTVNSTYVRYASPSKLAVEVGFKDFADKGTPAGRYLQHQVTGGPRPAKPNEKLLYRSGVLPRGRFLVPTGVTPLPLDGFGNVPASKYVQVLSRLKSLREIGSQGNVTTSRRSQSKRTERDFFVGRPGGLPLGIYARLGKRPTGKAATGRPASVRLPRGFHTVFYITGQPMYQPRFPIPSILNQAFEQTMRDELQRRIQEEIVLGKGLR